jgi:hypothetical protein
MGAACRVRVKADATTLQQAGRMLPTIAGMTANQKTLLLQGSCTQKTRQVL